MRKLIDIPDDKIKDIKRVVVESESSSVKEYIEHTILEQTEKDTFLFSLLAKNAIEDGQIERFLMGMFYDIYIQLKKQDMKGDIISASNDPMGGYLDFLLTVKSCANHCYNVIKEDEEETN